MLSKLTDQIPPVLQAAVGSMVRNSQPLFNVICTNVPGPQIPLYLVGRKVAALYPLVPLSMGLGLNFCLTNYNGVLYRGVVADSDLVPNVGVVAGHIQSVFDALESASSATA